MQPRISRMSRTTYGIVAVTHTNCHRPKAFVQNLIDLIFEGLLQNDLFPYCVFLFLVAFRLNFQNVSGYLSGTFDSLPHGEVHNNEDPE